MPIITLTSDLGERDHYVAAVKGNIYRQCQDANVVDISHQVSPFDIFQAAFILKNAYVHFPEGSIHLVSVESATSEQDKILLIEQDGHYFIGYDNGIFSLIFDDHPQDIIELKTSHIEHPTFLFRDVMVKAACDLADGQSPESLGSPVAQITEREPLQPVISDNSIRGNIIHFDHYGNAMTNIKEKLFKSIGQERRFSLYFKRNESLREISPHYNAAPEGEKLCLFNTAGYLEIAINKGEARKLFGLKIGDIIQMDFDT